MVCPKQLTVYFKFRRILAENSGMKGISSRKTRNINVCLLFFWSQYHSYYLSIICTVSHLFWSIIIIYLYSNKLKQSTTGCQANEYIFTHITNYIFMHHAFMQNYVTDLSMKNLPRVKTKSYIFARFGFLIATNNL